MKAFFPEYTHSWFNRHRQTLSMEEFCWFSFIFTLGWFLMMMLECRPFGHIMTKFSLANRFKHQSFSSRRTSAAALIHYVTPSVSRCLISLENNSFWRLLRHYGSRAPYKNWIIQHIEELPAVILYEIAVVLHPQSMMITRDYNYN